MNRYSVVGTSYGGFVAYRMAVMWPERVEKVVIASSGVNLRYRDNVELVKDRARVEKVEEVLLPGTAAQLRVLLGLAFSKRRVSMPDFLLNDVIRVSFSFISPITGDVQGQNFSNRYMDEKEKQKKE